MSGEHERTKLLRRALALQAHAQADGPEAGVARKQLSAFLSLHPDLRDFMEGGGSTCFRVIPRSPWHCDVLLKLATDLPVNIEDGHVVVNGSALEIARLRGEWQRLDKRMNAAFEAVVGLLLEETEAVPNSRPPEPDAGTGSGGFELLAGLMDEPPPQPIHPAWWDHYLADEGRRQEWLPNRGRYARELRRGAKRLLIAVETVKLPRLTCDAKVGRKKDRRYGGE